MENNYKQRFIKFKGEYFGEVINDMNRWIKSNPFCKVNNFKYILEVPYKGSEIGILLVECQTPKVRNH